MVTGARDEARGFCETLNGPRDAMVDAEREREKEIRFRSMLRRADASCEKSACRSRYIEERRRSRKLLRDYKRRRASQRDRQEARGGIPRRFESAV